VLRSSLPKKKKRRRRRRRRKKKLSTEKIKYRIPSTPVND
jgi:hypothetical protein